jgi:predicted unusual protein kinase regulating ubiquinone biosynthesis (AarF/ABC1/UbiB family)
MLARVVRTGKFVVDVRRRFAGGKRVDKAAADWLKGELQKMGPTYIKIGQFVASRRDLFDDKIVEAFKSLQDSVDPAPSAETVQIITRRLGGHIRAVKKIEIAPMACASIGQVHRVVLKTGREVAIKVRRPDVQDEFEMDIAILMFLLRVMDMLNTENISETRELLHDFRAWFTEEMDYTRELQNYRLLRRHAKPTLVMPEFYEELCHEDFLVMSYLPSYKISAVKDRMRPQARKELAMRLMDTFIGQLVTDGVMHGDPHEGNLGVAADGRIVLYDMGNVIQVDADTRGKLKRMIFEIVTGNMDDAVRLMHTISLFEVRDDVKVKKLLVKYAEYMRTVDVSVMKTTSFDSEMRRDLPIKFSSTVFRIVRVFGLLEGLCKDLDPEFSYEPVFQKYMQVIGGDSDYVTYKATSDLRKAARALVDFLDGSPS